LKLSNELPMSTELNGGTALGKHVNVLKLIESEQRNYSRWWWGYSRYRYSWYRQVTLAV